MGLARGASRLTMNLEPGTSAPIRRRESGLQRGAVVEGARSVGRERRIVMENVNRGAEIRPWSKGAAMLEITALDATRTGTEADDLANKLRSRVVGQDEAIQHIARTYQTYLAGLAPVGRPIG